MLRNVLPLGFAFIFTDETDVSHTLPRVPSLGVFCFLNIRSSCWKKLRHDCAVHDCNGNFTNQRAGIGSLLTGMTGQRSVGLNLRAVCFVAVWCWYTPAPAAMVVVVWGGYFLLTI